jgi:hypothetical protein
MRPKAGSGVSGWKVFRFAYEKFSTFIVRVCNKGRNQKKLMGLPRENAGKNYRGWPNSADFGSLTGHSF